MGIQQIRTTSHGREDADRDLRRFGGGMCNDLADRDLRRFGVFDFVPNEMDMGIFPI